MASQKKKNSSKLLWWIGGIVVLLFIIAVVFMPHTKTAPQMASYPAEFDFDNQTLMVGNQSVMFTDGTYKSPDGNHTSQMTTRYANPSQTREAAVLVDYPGGSGTFYYIVGATKKDGNVIYSTPLLLGDRIKVESVKVDDTSVTVTYLDHPTNAAMAAEPTEMKTVTYTFKDDGTLSQ